MKQLYTFVIFTCLFVFSANLALEARHHHHVEIRNTYITPAYYTPAYVVEQPVYVRQYAPVVYSQPVYQERVIVRDRCCPAAGLITSFALGLGFGLLR